MSFNYDAGYGEKDVIGMPEPYWTLPVQALTKAYTNVHTCMRAYLLICLFICLCI